MGVDDRMQRSKKTFIAAVLVLFALCLVQSISNDYSCLQMGEPLCSIAQSLTFYVFPLQWDFLASWWLQRGLGETRAVEAIRYLADLLSAALLLLSSVGLVWLFRRVKWWVFLLIYLALSLVAFGLVIAALNQSVSVRTEVVIVDAQSPAAPSPRPLCRTSFR